MSWNVRHAERIGSQPHVIRQLHLAAADMIRAGEHPGDTLVFGGGDSGLWVELNGEVIGALLYQLFEDQGYLWVSLSWVDPRHRGKGIWCAMNADVEQRAREKGCHYVERMVLTGNQRMEQVIQKSGYRPARTTYHKELR